jgi:pheromone shutdown-related protein TraB
MTTEIEENNVDLIEVEGKKVYLVGTAHVSRTSADLVEKCITDYKPDTVCIELCASRHESLQNPDRWRETDIFNVIRQGKTYVLLAQLVLSSFQKRLATKFGIKPGEEMHRAMEIANSRGAHLELIDREIRTTLKRAWARAGFLTMCRVSATLLASIFSKEELSEAEIEELKVGSTLSAMMAEFGDFLPGVKDALIDERDSYMAEKIRRAPGETIVAVVGAGHVPGMKKKIHSAIDLEVLDEIPPPGKLLKIIGWGIPALILGMFVWGFSKSGLDTSIDMIIAWTLANGLFSALGALLALAHPLTILTAFVAAPITSLNPTIAAGWVCGLVEALLRKPRVSDLETVADDIASVKGFWGNRVTRIFLVMLLANLGSMIGTFVGGVRVASFLR